MIGLMLDFFGYHPYTTLLEPVPLHYMHLEDARQLNRYLDDTMDEIPFSLHDCFRDTAQVQNSIAVGIQPLHATQLTTLLKKVLT